MGLQVDLKYLIVGISTKNMAPHFFEPPQHAPQNSLPKKWIERHWLSYDDTVPSLNGMKILTVQSAEKFESTIILSD